MTADGWWNDRPTWADPAGWRSATTEIRELLGEGHVRPAPISWGSFTYVEARPADRAVYDANRDRYVLPDGRWCSSADIMRSRDGVITWRPASDYHRPAREEVQR